MELDVFGFDFERKGVIDVYEQAKFTFNYEAHSDLMLIVEATQDNIDFLITNNGDTILTKTTKKTGLRRGFFVDRVQYTDESKRYIEAHVLSLSALLNKRLILGLQSFTGGAEAAMRYFVTNNAIAPTNLNRVIPNLILGNLIGLDIQTNEAFSNKQLDESLWEMAIKFDVAYDIFLDIDNQQLVFEVWQGVDRSDEQDVNDPVIFSKEWDNVLNQSYVDDKSDYRNTAVISGDNETVTLIVNDENSGLARSEVYFDEKNLVGQDEQSTNAILTSKAQSRLSLDYKRIQSFETDVIANSQFVYDEHYSFGDKVTIRNDEIIVLVHTRVVKAIEDHTKNGFSLEINFGSSVPTPFEKIRKRVS